MQTTAAATLLGRWVRALRLKVGVVEHFGRWLPMPSRRHYRHAAPTVSRNRGDAGWPA